VRRVKVFIESHGGHFEHLYKKLVFQL
jgi:hypothetical protein